jgi:hypothetical protein
VERKTPPNAGDIAALVQERIDALSGNYPETTLIEWRGSSKTVPVISMPVDLLSYNPGTHRIRAQRSLDPVRDALIDHDPFSSAAQTYIHELLMADPADPRRPDPDFAALQEDIKLHGQKEPGIITRQGILINGNTRRAALRELGQHDIRVGVVPSDAGLDDINAIELALQLRREYKRDYSFVNNLLAIEEQVNAGRLTADICRDFRIKQTTFDRSRWILQLIREAIERSAVRQANGDDLKLRLVDFETHQGKLEELHRTYSALKKRAPDEAELLREQRLLALVLEKSKTDLRLIEPDFYEKYLSKRLDEDLLPKRFAEERPSGGDFIPGTSVRAAALDARIIAMRNLADQALQAQAVTTADGAAVSSADVSAAAQVVSRLRDSMDAALQLAGKSTLLRRRRFAPVDRLSDANEDLSLCLDAVADARATGSFSPEDLDDELVRLRQSLTRLARFIGRSETTNGDGITWLTKLTRTEAPRS